MVNMKRVEVMDEDAAIDLMAERAFWCGTCDGKGGRTYAMPSTFGYGGNAEGRIICKTCHGEQMLSWYERDGERIEAQMGEVVKALVEGYGS